MARSKTIDVAALIESQAVSRFLLRTVTICFLVQIMDGFDLQVTGYIAPYIVRDWHVDRAALGPVFSAGYIGLMIGGFLFGPLGDRFGRKTVIIWSTVLFGICCFLTAWAHSLNEMLVYRLITGIGLGGTMPATIALVCEYAPARVRATMLTVMICGNSFGAVLGGLVASNLISVFGWNVVFYVGGIIPVLLVPFIILWAPESIGFLILRGRTRDAITSLLHKIAPDSAIEQDAEFTWRNERRHGFPVKYLFTDGYALPTSMLWIAAFMVLLCLNFVFNWLPFLLNSVGIPLDHAVSITVGYQVGALLGAIILGRFVDRFGFFRVLGVTFVAGALLIALLGQVGQAIAVLAAMSFGAGFCIVGGQQTVNALSGAFYPASVRSTGSGWALGFGRIGAVIGPLLGSFLLGLQWEMQHLFFVAAGICLACSAAVLMMGYSARAKVVGALYDASQPRALQAGDEGAASISSV
jgi:AAHS family 4-hydroxybenzoate transporter-like MFS transporter